MKVSLKTQTGILGLNANFATLTNIDSNNYYYQITYSVNPGKALSNGCSTVRIDISKQPPNKVSNTNITVNQPQSVIQNLLTKSSKSKDLIRTYQTNNIILSVNSDFTKSIPNDQVSALANTSALVNPVVRTVKQVKLMSVASLSAQNVATMPVLQKSLPTPTLPAPITTTQVKTLSTNLIFKSGIDPASIMVPTKTIASSNKNIAGIQTKPASTAAIPTAAKALITSVIQKTITPAITTAASLPKQEMLPVVMTVPQVYVSVIANVNIPISAIGENDFYVILTVVNGSGITVETLYNVVPNSKYIAALKIPRDAPTVKSLGAGKLGITKLSIKQVDQYATGVYVYRRTISKNKPLTDATYTLIGNLKITNSEDAKIVSEKQTNLNPTIYRVIPYNNSGVIGGEFTSIVSKSERTPLANNTRKKQLKPIFVGLSYTFVDNGISVEVRNVPNGPIVIILQRYDLTLHEKEPSYIGNPVLLNTLQHNNSVTTIVDSTVNPGHFYEYNIKFLYKNGESEISSDFLIVEYLAVQNNIVNTTTSQPVIKQANNNLDVTFTINSSLVQTNIDLIQSAMQNQGIFNLYQQDIINNKQDFQNLLGYEIIRFNLTTGEMENLGVTTNISFSDQAVGGPRTVKPLSAGEEYRYVITTYIRDPETTIPTFTRTVQTSTNTSYTLTPSKWYHPITLTKGNITTSDTLTTNYSKNDFTFGTVGDITIVNVSLTSAMPTVSSLVLSNIGNTAVLVEWKVQGDTNKIDHFIITKEILGMRTIVGKNHNISKNGSFQFVEDIEKNEHGMLSYYVLPVYYDYHRGTEIKSNQVIV